MYEKCLFQAMKNKSKEVNFKNPVEIQKPCWNTRENSAGYSEDPKPPYYTQFIKLLYSNSNEVSSAKFVDSPQTLSILSFCFLQLPESVQKTQNSEYQSFVMSHRAGSEEVIYGEDVKTTYENPEVAFQKSRFENKALENF